MFKILFNLLFSLVKTLVILCYLDACTRVFFLFVSGFDSKIPLALRWVKENASGVLERMGGIVNLTCLLYFFFFLINK